MYTIEELPDSSSSLTPGWTYVRDTGFDPAKAAIAPALGRKRGIRDSGRGAGGGAGGGGDISARQRNAIIRHLAELDRENHRDVAIPVRKDTGRRTKSTQNVRRILASQKTFRNFLDDEEAALSLQSQSQSGPGPGPGTRSSRIIKTRRLKAQSQHPSEPPSQLPESDFDTHPLLRSYTPSLPSERIMDALLSEPALSYNSARAGPPGGQGKSQRFFCALCGHWGKIRCKHCQVRTCGLECFRLHEDSRCGAFF